MDSENMTSQMFTLTLRDWDHSRHVTMDFPAEASVAEAVEEARHELNLPPDVGYLALHRDRQLDDLRSLRDSGITTDSDVDLMPDVKAG